MKMMSGVMEMVSSLTSRAPCPIPELLFKDPQRKSGYEIILIQL